MPIALGRLVPRLARRPRAVGAARSVRGHARRAVLWALAVAALATIGFSVVLETAAPTLRDPEHGHRMAALRAKSERPLVVFIGSSWTQNAIDPEAMNWGDDPGAPRAFNYGLGGALPPYLPVVARRLWDADVRPAAVVVEVFPVLLRFDDTTQTKFAASGAGLTLPDLIRLTPASTRPDVHTRWLEARLVPWYTYRHQVMGASTRAGSRRRRGRSSPRARRTRTATAPSRTRRTTCALAARTAWRIWRAPTAARRPTCASAN
ncbi:MAG: hypothetical protein FJ304_27550 [Planctomycetes bacterium]|nr:hypothetical protein [Planctomycetota bacterium]